MRIYDLEVFFNPKRELLEHARRGSHHSPNLLELKSLTRTAPFRLAKGEHSARLAIECFTYLFQRDEVDSQCLIFFQAPQRRMTNASLLSQPKNRSPASSDELSDPNLNHRASPFLQSGLPHTNHIVYPEYIAYLTHTSNLKSKLISGLTHRRLHLFKQ